MDNFLRVYFAVPEARAALQGAVQDPSLGTGEAPERPGTPRKAFSLYPDLEAA
jgi:hypothetical protein